MENIRWTRMRLTRVSKDGVLETGRWTNYIGLNVGAMVFMTSKAIMSVSIPRCLMHATVSTRPKKPSSVMAMKPEFNQSAKIRWRSIRSVGSERDFTLCVTVYTYMSLLLSQATAAHPLHHTACERNFCSTKNNLNIKNMKFEATEQWHHQHQQKCRAEVENYAYSSSGVDSDTRIHKLFCSARKWDEECVRLL